MLSRCAPLLMLLSAGNLPAQQWNDARAIDLATRATERRATQMADPTLASYSASARGTITFQGKLGERIPMPPITVKHTEIATKLYWTQPGRSKQIVVGLRDTSFFPEDIAYYQDRYGIIQNNFPDVIRLGDGSDVRDVPHPLSRQGLLDYDFRVMDSASMIIGTQVIDFYTLNVRPKDDTRPRVIGRILVTRSDAAVVRMQFTFTRAAYIRDQRNVSLTVTLENALVEQRFWLPRIQQLDLVRSEKTFDFPVNAMIRARWEVYDYEVNIDVARVSFVGPEIISSPPDVLRQYKWDNQIMESLPPDIRILTPTEIRQIRTQAEQLVQAAALSKGKGAAPSARSVSDLIRVNRFEGPAAGLGVKLRPGGPFNIGLSGRYGFSDSEAKGRLSIGFTRLALPSFELYAERDYRDVGIVQERSWATNSIAATFGSDYTNLHDSRSIGLVVDPKPLGAVRPRVELSYQLHSPLAVEFRPVTGSFAGSLPAARTRNLSLHLSAAGTSATAPLGFSSFTWEFSSEFTTFDDRSEALSLDDDRVVRAHARLNIYRPIGASTLALAFLGGTVQANANVPIQKLIFLGGPVSAPGYGFHEFAATTAASMSAELRIPVPFFSLSLGKYGRSPATATIAPRVGTAYLSDPSDFTLKRSGFYPSVGIGGSFFYDLLRIDLDRGLRGGNNRVFLSIDIMREFWGIL